MGAKARTRKPPTLWVWREKEDPQWVLASVTKPKYSEYKEYKDAWGFTCQEEAGWGTKENPIEFCYKDWRKVTGVALVLDAPPTEVDITAKVLGHATNA